MLASKEFRSPWRSAWIFSLTAFLLFMTAAHAGSSSTHSASDGLSGSATKRRQDRDELIKRLSDVVSRSSVSRPKSKSTVSIFRLVGADDSRVKEAETQGIPATISLVALRVENGLTPKELFDLVNKLKNDIGADAITADARELARRLLAPPSKLKELYKKADGSFDLDALLKDLGLDGSQFRERAEALKKALEEDPTAPLQEEEKDPKTDPKTDDAQIVDPSQFDADGTVDPSQVDLGDQGLDDTVIDQDDLVFDNDAQRKLDEEAAQKAAAEAAKNNDKNNNNKKDKDINVKPPGAPKPPPPPQPPISIPPISAGGGGDKGGQQQPLPMPPPPEIPPMQPMPMPPPPPGDSGLSPELLSLLLKSGKTGERPPDAGMQDMLQTFAAMNQQTINAILQLGSTMLAAGAARTQITATPPAGPANVYGSQGRMSARIQVSSGARTTATAGPRSSPSGSTIANSMQATSPREGTVPGFSTGSAQPRTSGAKPAAASSEARWIVKPRH